MIFAMTKSPENPQLVPVDVELPVVGTEVPHYHDDEEQGAMSLSNITTFRPYMLAESFETEAQPKTNTTIQGTTEKAAANTATKATAKKAYYWAWCQKTMEKPAYWYRRDAEKAKAQSKAYYHKNRKKIFAKRYTKYRDNPVFRAASKAYQRAWYQKNAERLRAKSREQNAKCRDKAKAKTYVVIPPGRKMRKATRKKNPDIISRR